MGRASGIHGELHALAGRPVFCQARQGNGWSCARKAAAEVETDRGPIALCKLHRGVLGTRGGLTLTNGTSLVNMPGGYRCFDEDLRPGVRSS